MAISFSRRVRQAREGWPIVGWAALGMAGLTGTILAWNGLTEDGLHVLIRASARTSALLFSSAFTASSLALMWRADLTRWMLRNRRYLGVSFAVSHVVHLAAIVAVASMSAKFRSAVDMVTLAGGGLAYVFVFAMTATSFDRGAAWLGPRRWRRLHKTGAYYIWFIFFFTYAPEAIKIPIYLPFTLLLLVALAVRILARRWIPARQDSRAAA